MVGVFHISIAHSKCTSITSTRTFLIYFGAQDRATQRCDLSGAPRLRQVRGVCSRRPPNLSVITGSHITSRTGAKCGALRRSKDAPTGSLERD